MTEAINKITSLGWEAPQPHSTTLGQTIARVMSVVKIWFQSFYNESARRLYAAYCADALCSKEVGPGGFVNNDYYLSMREALLSLVYGEEERPLNLETDMNAIMWDEGEHAERVDRSKDQDYFVRASSNPQLRTEVHNAMLKVVRHIRALSVDQASITTLKNRLQKLNSCLSILR